MPLAERDPIKEEGDDVPAPVAQVEQHDDCSTCGTLESSPLPRPEWMVEGPWYHQGTGEKFMIVEPCKLQGPGAIWHKGVAARGENGQLECRVESRWRMVMKLTPKP